ncbi:MAG: site-specific integrase [Promicromonosporaceae bacterium]|nr:site-specific integrase [Promicromonosporaceae bacterium]
MTDTKTEGQAWGRDQLAKLSGGHDLKAGRVLVGDQLPKWVEHRTATVAFKTVQADRNSLAWVPKSMRRLQVDQVTKGQVSDLLATLARKGYARSSLTRFRATLRAFVGWCVTHGLIRDNPVVGVAVPKSATPAKEINPFTRTEIEERIAHWRALNEDAAGLVEFIVATGLRGEEWRILTPADIQWGDHPAVIVSRAQPEGAPMKGTKSGKTRRVPLPDHVIPWVKSRMGYKWIAPYRTVATVSRKLDWANTAGGRTFHELRHTAITLWLSEGIDMPTAKSWSGHRDLSTLSRYTNWLGIAADAAAVALLNKTRADRLAQEAEKVESGPNDEVHNGYTIEEKEDA